jgi:hypothetical protein
MKPILTLAIFIVCLAVVFALQTCVNQKNYAPPTFDQSKTNDPISMLATATRDRIGLADSGFSDSGHGIGIEESACDPCSSLMIAVKDDSGSLAMVLYQNSEVVYSLGYDGKVTLAKGWSVAKAQACIENLAYNSSQDCSKTDDKK